MLDRNTQLDMSARPHRLDYTSVRESPQTQQLADVLEELYELLEEYGPYWYTQEHREKAESALQLLKKS